MQPLTLEEFREHAQTTSKIAVFEEVNTENLTPVMAYQLLHQLTHEEGAMFEDLQDKDAHRYSYLCFQPIKSVSIFSPSTFDVLDTLRDIKQSFQCKTRDEVAHLISKAIGFITYDAGCAFANVTHPNINQNTSQTKDTLPLILFHFYTLTITFDHEHQKILISHLAEVKDEVDDAYYQARKEIESIKTTLSSLSHSNGSSSLPINTFPDQHQKEAAKITVDISDTEFMQMVNHAKEHIKCGDAFQIVISRCFKRPFTATPFTIYQHLRDISPAPFMFYFPMETQTIIGASPERLVSVKQNKVTVNPIAGTRKRVNEYEDDAISADLLNDKKELAEHMMLVDLARNDVGAVSNPGSVEVTELLKVKHYSHISHITSTITGELKEEHDALDALKATIPAGTLSGAPKIRAMEIIAKLEKSPRGLYGGAICRFDLADNFDSCIAIRMAVLQDGTATVRTGAGIVFDSDPKSEAQETYQKAHGLLVAFAKAHGETIT